MDDDDKDKSPEDIAFDWWLGLQDIRNGKPNPTRDRAARARLRRAGREDAMIDDAVLALYRRLPGKEGASYGSWKLPLAIRLARILTHVREHIGQDDQSKGKRKFAASIGRASFDNADSAKLKPLRFKRLLQATDEEEIVRQFRRALHVIGGTANVRDLAYQLIHWHQEGTRARFAFDYLAAGQAAPGQAETIQE